MHAISTNLAKGPLSTKVINFVNAMKTVVDKGRDPGFTPDNPTAPPQEVRK